jgi:hypothetical protein
VNAETKEQSKQWIYTYSPKEFKQMLPTRKPIATVFRDRKWVLMVKFMQQGTTMSKMYCKILKNQTA